MSGLRISCTQSVEIGTNSVLANSIIADSEKLPAATDQSATVAALCGTKPVLIGSHVWIAMNSYIMSGTVLGDECVVASGAVVFGATMEPRSLVGGNPGRKLAETRAP
jgi:acetyltransferase-like isoleucine patch superfamily enzyme